MTPSSLTTRPVPEVAVPVRGGSRRIDLSGNARLRLLMDTVWALSRAVEPSEVLKVFTDRATELWGPRGYISLSTRGLRPGEYKITRMILEEDQRDEMTSADPWSRWASLPTHAGGLLGDIVRAGEPVLLHHLDVDADPVLGDRIAGYHSLMAMPLFDNGQALNWAVFLRREPDGYTEEDLEESILRSNLVGATVRNTLAAKQLREASAHIQAEVTRMASIQRSLLPERVPPIEGLSIAVSYETFDRVGGDYYDFIPICCGPAPEHRLAGTPQGIEPCHAGPWGIIIADASGHGPSAAVVMAMVHAILHAFPKEPSGPSEVLEHLNRHLCSKRIESTFVTAFFALFDPRTRSLRYARAGHNPPILKNPGPGGSVHRLDAVGNLPLGIMPDITFDTAAVTLEPGQTVVLYTDGITEAFGAGGEMFGVEGIERALVECTGEPECVVGSITGALRGHEGGVRPSDDQTIVALKLRA
jgi:sigma-B regulation protein RsbU (phosphoserine phosphatase)